MDRLTGKPDMSQVNFMDGKAFTADGTMDFTKKTKGKAEQKTFVFDEKMQTADYSNTRSFFGLKNPWFGKKVYDSNAASLWSKTAILNADQKFAVDKAQVNGFVPGERKAFLGNGVVPTPIFEAKAQTPGAMDQINDQLKKKNMTIDQVRDLLNKN